MAAGARACRSAAEMAGQCDRIITVVVDAAQTREVLFGADGAASAMQQGVVMMCSTIAPTDAADIAGQLTLRGIAMLDAPISGGPARAEAGIRNASIAGRSAKE